MTTAIPQTTTICTLWEKASEAIATLVENMDTRQRSAKARAKAEHKHSEHCTKEKERANPAGNNQEKAKEERTEATKVERRAEKGSKANAGHVGR